MESVRFDLMKEAILCYDLYEIHTLSEESISSFDATSSGLPITDLTTRSTISFLVLKTYKKTKLNNPHGKTSAMPSESVKCQKILKAAIEEMQRKVSPEKESDTYRTIQNVPQ